MQTLASVRRITPFVTRLESSNPALCILAQVPVESLVTRCQLTTVGVTFAALHGLVEDTQYVRPQHNAVVALTENPSDALKDVGIVD